MSVCDLEKQIGSRFIFDTQHHLFFTLGEKQQMMDAQDLSKPTGKIHRINDDGTYTPRTGGRQIRVYTELDVRLMFGDLFAKLETNYGRDASS